MTREWLAAIPDTSISGRRVVRELMTRIERRGKPQMIVSDNGTEFTSNAILRWSKEHHVEWHYIAPGKPMQNGYIESFQRTHAGRVAQREPVSRSRPGPANHYRLGRRLQHEQAAFIGSATERRRPMPVISPQLAIALRYMGAPRDGQLLTPRQWAYQLPRL